MSVREMLDRVDSRELSEWMAYYMLKNKPHSHKEGQQSVDEMKEALMGFNPKRKG